MANDRPRRRSRWSIVLLVLLGLCLGAGIAFWRALTYEPDFYRSARDIPAYRQESASQELEQTVRNLHDAVNRDSTWEQVFRDEDLNAWLATELPRQHARLLPTGVSEPRVAIGTERVRLAARWTAGSVSTVVSLECDVFRTPTPNEVGVRVRRVRAGAVPLSLDRWLDELKKAAQKSELPLRVESSDGSPTFFVTIPAKSTPWPRRRLTLDRLELSDGRITLGGRSEPK